jgi:hypothetical protein
VNLDRVEEDMAAEYSEEEEDDILHIGNKLKTTTLKEGQYFKEGNGFRFLNNSCSYNYCTALIKAY